MKSNAALVIAIALVSLAACDPAANQPADAAASPDVASAADAAPTPDAPVSADASTGPFSVAGTTSGDHVPAAGQAAVLWMVFAGNDHQYVFGHGTQTGPGFKVDFTGAPPPEALNNGTGVGIVVLFDLAATVPPEGTIITSEPAGVLGVTGRHSIVYRAPGAAAQLPWSSAFPEGYACGKCVDSATSFDTYEPVACSQVDLQAPTNLSTIDFCNFF